jgi:formate dehydrogenase subunit beta
MMSDWYKIDRQSDDLLTDIRKFFRSVLELESVSAMLVPRKLPGRSTVMPALVSRPELLAEADPLAPVFPVNSAKNLSRLTRRGLDAKIAAIVRPCEIRAHVELVKLHQSSAEPVVLISMDCPGAYSNRAYPDFVEEKGADAGEVFLKDRLSGSPPSEKAEVSTACQICDHPVPEGADIGIAFFGADPADALFLEARTEKGREILEAVGAESAKAPEKREQAVSDALAARIEARDRVFSETEEAIASVEKLSAYLADCVNCYNCRVACPVCYCRECVFTTDVFDHEPIQYLQWTDRKGALKMPTDTVFYHITRLVHMSTACVGCGQCSNACPNDIALTELFRAVAKRTQAAFDYEAGRSTEEPPPLLVFKEDEFSDIVGIGS